MNRRIKMCQCLEKTVPNDVLRGLKQRGIEIKGLPYIAGREYFKGDFYYYAIAIDVEFYEIKYRNKKDGTQEQKIKKQKRPLIPDFCPFCGEKYIKEQL